MSGLNEFHSSSAKCRWRHLGFDFRKHHNTTHHFNTTTNVKFRNRKIGCSRSAISSCIEFWKHSSHNLQQIYLSLASIAWQYIMITMLSRWVFYICICTQLDVQLQITWVRRSAEAGPRTGHNVIMLSPDYNEGFLVSLYTGGDEEWWCDDGDNDDYYYFCHFFY